GKGTVREHAREEAEGREINEAATVDALEGHPVAGELWRRLDPLLQAHIHVRTRLVLPMSVPDLVVDDAIAVNRGDRLQARPPLAVRFQVDPGADAILIEFHWSGRRDPGLAEIQFTAVAKHEAPGLHARETLPLLGQRILDLEEVREVRSCLDPHVKVY